MTSQTDSLIFLPTILLFLIASTTLINHTQSQTQEQSSNYDLCPPFNCSNITFSFPFSPFSSFGSAQFDCGLPGFQITCDHSSSIPSSIEFSGRHYQVKQLFLSDLLVTVVDHTLINDIKLGLCTSLENLTNSISNGTVGGGAALALPVGGVNLTVFKCPIALPSRFFNEVVGNYSCKDGNYWAYIWGGTGTRRPVGPLEMPIGCEHVSLPVSGASLPLLASNNITNGSGDGSQMLLAQVLSNGFQLGWPNITDCDVCQMRGGRCGYDGSSRRVVCFCQGGCIKQKSNRWKLIVGIATGSICALLAVVLLRMFKYKRRIARIFKPSYFGKNQTTGDERKAKEFIKNYQSTLLTNYSYNDIKKMTNNFKEKLGEGGYGNVFKGKLPPDGRFIAVKMLMDYRDNSQNFLSEITSIGRIHHVNVIRLLGFCWDGSRQALVYEYMPNKSLGDLLHKGEVSVSLGLTRLHEISIGVAHGLEYLHNGCDSRILHLDIKPQNVLLDQNFDPKISDFGLAKVYSRNQSAVTMTKAGGTIGYIAPEILFRNLGKPSHKSDVYSFGMLLLEMVGAKTHVQPEANTSSEAQFPGWIYDKLMIDEERDNMELEDFVVGVEVYIARKMLKVGLWCIQINPKDRPSMTRVVEMLCGNVEAIEMPPKPIFFSPPRKQLEQETIISSNESESSVLALTSSRKWEA
ncbi:hypothetical protein ACSBR2_006117 [Camellia fascicularis]